MTSTAEKIAIMQAYEDGEIVECYLTGSKGNIWNVVTLVNPIWNWKDCNYRITDRKPIFNDSIIAESYKIFRTEDIECKRAYIEGANFAKEWLEENPNYEQYGK